MNSNDPSIFSYPPLYNEEIAVVVKLRSTLDYWKKSEQKQWKYKEEHSNIIEEKNIKGGSGGPKLKKKFEKNGGSMGGVRGVMVEQIFSKKLVFEKKP